MYLITGAAGFIGATFANRLAQEISSCDLILLDSLTYSSSLARLAQPLKNEARCYFGHSVNDAETLSGILSRFPVTHVIHFAAETHVDRSIKNPAPFIDTNILGTFTLLEAFRMHPASKLKLFVQVSTDEVYGSLAYQDKPFTQTTAYQPHNPYSATKAAADHLVRAWQHTYGIPAVITHSSNNYGPWQTPDKLIPKIIWRALHEESLPLYGNGLQIRDWLHVEDHAEALLAVTMRAKAGSEYLIGGHCERTNLDITQKIEARIRPGKASLIRLVEDRPGHDLRYALDTSAIESELGFRPKRQIEDSLDELIAWSKTHRTWLKEQLTLSL